MTTHTDKKTSKEPKEPKAPKAPKEPKAPKTPKEPKAPKTPKEPKAPKAPKEPKAPKAPKPQINDNHDNIVLKKRGRKPKGGKIINAISELNNGNIVADTALLSNNSITANKLPTQSVVSNIILHLKCGYSDLTNNLLSSFKYEPTVVSIESYTDGCNLSETAHTFKTENENDADPHVSSCDNININNNNTNNIENADDDDHDDDGDKLGNTGSVTHHYSSTDDKRGHFYPGLDATKHHIILSTTPAQTITSTNSSLLATADVIVNGNNNNHNHNTDMKEIWKKINKLKLILHKDGAHYSATQHSACFWCTYEFETPTIHIPKLFNKSADTYTVYGCFCSPECAASYLMKEPIDTSVRFERYHLLNALYSAVYNYDKTIKPAPDPHYLLTKFYGNLSIDEYRKLLKSDHLLYVVNKPLTHSLPELYEDNNEFMVNNKTTIPNTIPKTKKR